MRSSFLRALRCLGAALAGLQLFLIASTACAQEIRPMLSATSGHMFGITALSWDDRAGLVLTASADNSVKLWHAATGAVIRTFPVSNPTIRSIRNSVNDAAAQVAIGGNEGLRLWDGRTGALLQILEPATRLEKTITTDRAGTRRSPAHIRSDNGSEFIAIAVQQWLAKTAQDALFPSERQLVSQQDGHSSSKTLEHCSGPWRSARLRVLRSQKCPSVWRRGNAETLLFATPHSSHEQISTSFSGLRNLF